MASNDKKNEQTNDPTEGIPGLPLPTTENTPEDPGTSESDVNKDSSGGTAATAGYETQAAPRNDEQQES